MNSTFLAMGIATLLVVGIILSFAIASLLSGAFHFLFARPRFEILRSKKGENGFAFAMIWNSAREPAKFDTVRVRLYNPFGKPTQVETSSNYEASDQTFARDIDLGVGFGKILEARGLQDATVEIQIYSSRDQIAHHFSMKGRKFIQKRIAATNTVEEFNQKYKIEKPKKYYHTVSQSFIAEPIPDSEKKRLKIPTNPEFAGDFAAASGSDKKEEENFEVKKVWIAPGCIVCDACEGIYPEVFDVQEETCVIRPDAPLTNGLLIEEAAEACPVEVIKFEKA